MQASSFDQFTGTEKYIVSPDLHDAVNVSIVLQRLLLVKGEPGTGKTLLAHNIARALGKPLLVWNIQPTTKAKALPSLPPPPVPRPSPWSHPSGSAYPMRRRLSSPSDSHAAPRSAWLLAAQAGWGGARGGTPVPGGRRGRRGGAKSALNFLSAPRHQPE